MTDIVERLRYTANIRAIHRSDDDPIKRDCIEAAAEIERMRAALEEAAKECRVQLPLVMTSSQKATVSRARRMSGTSAR